MAINDGRSALAKNHDLYVDWVGGGRRGRISDQPDNVLDAFLDNYKDAEARRKAGILSVWVTETGSNFPIIGTAPPGWSPSDPHRENREAPTF